MGLISEEPRTHVTPKEDFEIVVIGGCGRVGLPLAITLADCGRRVAIYDIDPDALASVARGEMPFQEPGAAPILKQVIDAESLTTTSDDNVLSRADIVIIAVGTPVNDSGAPDTSALDSVTQSCAQHLRDGQLIVLRSTVSPGSTARLERYLAEGDSVDIVYCPERIAEGKAMAELRELPQIIGSRGGRARHRATSLFATFCNTAVQLTPEEAEFAKLATNAWRYMAFAIANELYKIATLGGLNFGRIREALQLDYPRADGLPAAGLAAGPCLPKDAAQLAAYAGSTFALGSEAIRVNTSLPAFLVDYLAERHELFGTKVGVLGVSFKKDSDDVRDSLSQVIIDELASRGAVVLCTDPYVDDPQLHPLDQVLGTADLLIVATPHSDYCDINTDIPVVDIWNVISATTHI